MAFLAVATSRAEYMAEVTSLTAHSRPHMHERLALGAERAPTHPPTAHYYCQARQEVRARLETIYFVCACPNQLKKI